ncbi:hypothetical protein KAU25_03415 [Candidatus Bathyarchaeota archaeon]|nr:hypothetical protein [Candidatus Bathyarchaeota archaeon]
MKLLEGEREESVTFDGTTRTIGRDIAATDRDEADSALRNAEGNPYPEEKSTIKASNPKNAVEVFIPLYIIKVILGGHLFVLDGSKYMGTCFERLELFIYAHTPTKEP